ncbi:predicted exporter [Terrimicrobium sacchariphilum]|uniref:Predicted exporter n=1 Tax=Terrimicrobium sacchariphilum TaxID=690879 RepID=A0A146GBP4_TERSA|nr:MMPL family transporter [Terrimicrobium sacchariphilum]GAT33998.1 predicted exporter [Terrimicrobium sacchariphilum]
MKYLSDLLASLIVRRQGVLLALGISLALLAGVVLGLRQNFDTDILNLLPASSPAVQGLKVYNADFTQARELAFLLTWKQPPDDAHRYREEFAELLKKQPWVVRVLDTPPLAGASGQVNEILAPLLLNLPPQDFRAALDRLSEGTLEERFSRLADQVASGSPKARFEWENDPLGLATAAAKPVWESVSLSDAFDLVSSDETAAIVPAITNQPDLSAASCQVVMAQVHQFIEEARKAMGPEGPEIGVTGRSAYVVEIAASMQRDIMLTSAVSMITVVGLFWLGFRRVLPLIGITLILAFTALISMVCGIWVFGQLNIIAISFCSILFGLGDDFSLLLCQHFYQARSDGLPRQKAIASSINHCLPGMLWVALTTGVGFLALSFSGSAGFAQLGFLVAAGVFLCAIFMTLFLFPFVRDSAGNAAGLGPAKWFADLCRNHAGWLVAASVGGAIVAGTMILLPWGALRFDITPASLEPRNTPAARTLADMMRRFPATFEPLMVVLPAPSAEKLHALDAELKRLQSEGKVLSWSSPSGLYLDPARVAENRRSLALWDANSARVAVQVAASHTGLVASPSLLEPIEDLTQALKITSANWRDYVGSESRWWFLLDRMVSSTSPTVIAYAKVAQGLTPADRLAIAKEIDAHVDGALVSGWSQTLASLVPWAQRELLVFGGAVAVLVAFILAFVYRNASLWLLHMASIIAALLATAATLKLFSVPINLLNVLAFPLMLGVGVDYGTHLILAARAGDGNFAGTIKAVGLSGLTTSTGFGALVLAQNPALSGLGIICGVGVLWCLLFSLLLVAPGAMRHESRLARRE